MECVNENNTLEIWRSKYNFFTLSNELPIVTI